MSDTNFKLPAPTLRTNENGTLYANIRGVNYIIEKETNMDVIAKFKQLCELYDRDPPKTRELSVTEYRGLVLEELNKQRDTTQKERNAANTDIGKAALNQVMGALGSALYTIADLKTTIETPSTN